MSKVIKLIVGLGNPGSQYEQTRHNAGAQLLELIARRFNAPLKADSKFHGELARTTIAGEDVRLIFPTDYMNCSGTSVAALTKFYKIQVDEILVIHDELDIPPGTIKLKQGGGHGGHNGLRDIISKLGNQKNFYRLRVGIGHPGNAKEVTNFVLGKAPAKEQAMIEASLDAGLAAIEKIVSGDMQKVMNELHRFKAPA